jgi:hypothetical protein
VADIEALSMLLSKIPLKELMAAESKMHLESESNSESSDSESKFESIFSSLNASSQFMTMAINRSQDFMKAR